MKFSLGQTTATPGALSALERSQQTPQRFLDRHISGDWGHVHDDDKQSNEDAVLHGGMIVSAYHTNLYEVIWVITEADRSSTTILLPEEY